ncbi:MAG TPA: DUF6049 family protein [Actinophytocola sp.]|uniref:DUF6049 family protein n=1 Tax=Actinophytocola sp. TaxID=1872138 RepID=UPI002DDCED1E|nr:DUF6049 family protein [Actinophytocola sp.]HEV2778492.1 DUF6049 family protein [Actinophytocola sp.]
MSLTRSRVVMAIAAVALAVVNPVGLAAGQPQPVPESPSRMRLEIDTLSPRVITAGTPTVTVTGKVTNTGDRRIDNVKVQLRRGEPLTTEQELRDARNQLTDSAVSPFVEVSRSLERGQSAPVSLTVDVRGTERSLRINEPGVYPLLVNVNGAPEFGGQARLAAVSVLLPALAIPGGPTVSPPADPTRLAMLWPLIDDRPRLPADEGLADSVAPGGRLHGLVNSVERAAAGAPDLLDALCFAVDPDLLQNVITLARSNGRGAPEAKTWIERVRALTADQCVVAVPFADADVVALSRAGAVDLAKLAVTSATIVGSELSPARPLPGVLWPVNGAIDQRTLLDLADTGTTTVLADPAHLRHQQGKAPYLVGESAGAGTRAVPIDTLVSSFLDDGPNALTGVTSQPATPAEERPVSVQNGLAALTFRAAFAGARGGTLLIAPPRRWAAPASELGVLLDTLRQVFAARLAEPQRLAQVVSGAPGGTASGLDYGAQDSSAEITPSATAEVVRINNAQRDLARAMQVDDTTKVDPQTMVSPIQYGLLRATSTAWRGQGDQADRAVAAVAGQLDALRGQVTVANPGRPLTLASGNSPIPVLISNALPVSVIVRISLGETPGLRPEPIPDVVIPARLSVNRYLPAEVTRAGRFTIDVSLSTPGGTELGTPARLELSSTAYGAVTLILTGTAAAALFLLVGLRIYRRVRLASAGGQPIEERAD